MPTFTYNKTEKLKSRKQLAQVFAEGKSFLVFPVKVFYKVVDNLKDGDIKAGVGASSRSFKKAVHRNRIKRLLREAYRKEKLPLHSFLQKQNKQLTVFMLYIDKTLPAANIVHQKMPVILQRLMKEIHEASAANT